MERTTHITACRTAGNWLQILEKQALEGVFGLGVRKVLPEIKTKN